MKIYAIRDRLIDYWMQPFAAPEHKAVQQALARQVNDGPETSDIAQAPHQFELHQLGFVTEDGHLSPEREFICDLSSLIRPGLRNRGERPNTLAPFEPVQSTGHPGGDRGNGHPNGAPVPSAPPATAGEAQEVLQGPRGGYPPRNGT